MTKTLISQIWREYQDTGDKRLLADAVRYADFGSNPQIQDEISAILLKSAGKRSDYDQKLRDRDIVRVHEINLKSGLSITASYDNISEELGLSADAVRKVIEKSAEKPD